MKFAEKTAVGLVAAVTLLLVGGCGSKNVVVNENRYTALGAVMAGKTAELCEGRGSVVMLVNQEDDGQDTGFGQTIAAFRKALSPAIKITATERLKLPLAMPGIEPFSPAQFAELLHKHSKVSAVVSFIGVPALKPEQISQLPSPRPKVVAVVTFQPPARRLFEQNVIAVAALPKPVNNQDLTKDGTAQARFDAQYQMVTAETAGALLH